MRCLFSTVAFVALASWAPACNRGVTPAQCGALLDRFVDLKISEDPIARSLLGPARDAARANKRLTMQHDPDVQQVENDCEVQVSRAEYDCAIKASTSSEWNACIQ